MELPAPSDREKTQIFMQRYIERFPAAGEIIVFDRSWYNRAASNTSWGSGSKEQHQRFLDRCPEIERYIVDGGIRLIKIWLDVGQDEQERRFKARIEDPVRQWKLSPMDLDRTGAGTTIRRHGMMLKATDRQACALARHHFG